jgi:hypothetical protein
LTHHKKTPKNNGRNPSCGAVDKNNSLTNNGKTPVWEERKSDFVG